MAAVRLLSYFGSETVFQPRSISIRSAKPPHSLARDRAVKRFCTSMKQPWDYRHERFEIKGILHQKAHGLDGARTNVAEEYFSRLGRAGVRISHHFAGSYPLWRANESSSREGNDRAGQIF